MWKKERVVDDVGSEIGKDCIDGKPFRPCSLQNTRLSETLLEMIGFLAKERQMR